MQRAQGSLRILATPWLIAAAMLAAGAGAGGASVASAAAPIRMADMFLVEQDGDWFCEDKGNDPARGVTCSPDHKPAQAAKKLLRELKREKLPNLYLRAGKARNGCRIADPAACQTGVPRHVPCRAAPSGPWCLLHRLRRSDVKLGVIVGAEDDAGNTRGVAELAWHACRISRADTTQLYTFLFVDLTRRLTTPQLRQAIAKIRAGKTGSGKRCPGVGGKRNGWPKVITNDNHTWDPANPESLDTGAWAHAKRLGRLGESEIAGADGDDATALTQDDQLFVQQVNAQGSRAVLRLEVPTQTSRFAGLPRPDQCSLLTRWARLQGGRQFTLLYPFYVHGVGSEAPYDSFAQHTFILQTMLMKRYPGRQDAGEPDCGGGGDEPGRASEDPADPPEDPVGPSDEEPPPPPPVRPAGVGAREPSAVTCRSARLHGWVNPHGNATSFVFELWRRDVHDTRATAPEHAGSGRDRVEVSSVAQGLVADTGYGAKLVATNAAGASVSVVVSFKTKRRC